MQEPSQESSTPEKSVDWAQALSETLNKSEGAAEKPAPKESTAEVEATPPVAETSEAPKSAEPVDALEPPEKWSDDVKTYFKSLDRVGQKFLIDREKDVESHLTKRTQELSEHQKRYQRLDDVLKPYDEVAKRSGADITPHVSNALQYYFAYMRDPVSTVKTLIQTNRLTPEALGLVEDGTDPAIKTLRDQLVHTQRELASIRQGQAHTVESQYVSQIDSFRDAKSEDGNPKHPYFENVRTLMAPLVASGKTLDEAYSQAVWSLPEYRSTAIKAEKSAAEKEIKEKAEKTRLEKVKHARAAETLAPSDTDKANGKTPFKGWEQALQQGLNKLRS